MTIIALLFALIFNPFTSQNSFSIVGTIRDQNGRSVDTSLRISLLDENLQSIKTQFSYGGRFQFKGLNTGVYHLRIEALGTPYEELTSPRIDLSGPRIKGGGTEEFYFDLVLKFKKGMNKESSPGVLFTQTVPDAARVEYERGMKSLPGNVDEAMAVY